METLNTPVLSFTRQRLVRLIIPLVIEQFLSISVGMFDTMMVSSAGEAAVSAVSLADSINMLFITLFAALGTGGAVVCAQFLGHREPDQARLAGKQLFLTCGLISLVVMVLFLIFRNGLLALIFGTVEPAVMEGARDYFFITVLSYPFIALYNAGAALSRSTGDSKLPMLTAVVMNVVNVAGNAIFIYGFELGPVGVGIATLISRALCAFLVLRALKNPSRPIYIDSYLHLGWRPDLIRRILIVGVPSGVENGMFYAGRLMLQSVVSTFGTGAMAAYAVSFNIAYIQAVPGTAIGLALLTVVGQCIGAGDRAQAKRLTYKLTGVAYIAEICLCTATILLLRPVLGLYDLTPAAAELAGIIVIIHGIGTMAIWPLSFLVPNAFRATGDAKFTMLISVISMWLCRVGLGILFSVGLEMGVLGITCAHMLDWVFRTIFFTVHLRRERWLDHRVI